MRAAQQFEDDLTPFLENAVGGSALTQEQVFARGSRGCARTKRRSLCRSDTAELPEDGGGRAARPRQPGRNTGQLLRLRLGHHPDDKESVGGGGESPEPVFRAGHNQSDKRGGRGRGYVFVCVSLRFFPNISLCPWKFFNLRERQVTKFRRERFHVLRRFSLSSNTR